MYAEKGDELLYSNKQAVLVKITVVSVLKSIWYVNGVSPSSSSSSSFSFFFSFPHDGDADACIYPRILLYLSRVRIHVRLSLACMHTRGHAAMHTHTNITHHDR